jgi:hypothetical protein
MSSTCAARIVRDAFLTSQIVIEPRVIADLVMEIENALDNAFHEGHRTAQRECGCAAKAGCAHDGMPAQPNGGMTASAHAEAE